MSKIRLHGSSSGYTEIAPVAASGNNTITLPNDGTIISKDSNGVIGVTSITVGTGVTIGDGKITCNGSAITNLSATAFPAGTIIQVLETTRLDASSHTINAGADYNPSYLRQSITTTGSNKVIVEGFFSCALDVATNWIGITLRRDSGDISASTGVASGSKRRISSVAFNQSDDNLISIPFSFLDSPSAGTHEYHLQITHGSGGNRTLYVNRSENDTNSSSGCRSGSIIRCMEVAA